MLNYQRVYRHRKTPSNTGGPQRVWTVAFRTQTHPRRHTWHKAELKWQDLLFQEFHLQQPPKKIEHITVLENMGKTSSIAFWNLSFLSFGMLLCLGPRLTARIFFCWLYRWTCIMSSSCASIFLESKCFSTSKERWTTKYPGYPLQTEATEAWDNQPHMVADSPLRLMTISDISNIYPRDTDGYWEYSMVSQ